MQTRDIFIVCPLLAVAALCYFVGFHRGERHQKRTDTEFNIRRTLHVLQDAESGNTTNIIKGSRIVLFGDTRAYDSLVSEGAVPDKFRGPLAKARRIADEVKTNLVVFDLQSLNKK
jgi:hypothetical protein